MRWGLLNVIVVVWLAAACGSKPVGLHPSSLVFEPTYVGDERIMDLSVLTLNGEPLKDPTFDLTADSADNPHFTLFGLNPLRAPGQLAFHPKGAGSITVNFVVRTGGQSFKLQAIGRGMEPQPCTLAALCQRSTFSFTEGQCVIENIPDGTRCGISDCETDQLCAAGVCTRVARENTPPVCKQDVPSVMLQPAWTYDADAGRDLIFPGLVDADDNLYVYDCHRDFPNEPCEIVSLTADGQRRWRIPESALPRYPRQPALSVIGRSLFVVGTANGANVTLAFHRSDGSLAWQRNDFSALVPVSSGCAAAVLEDNATVLVLDPATGAELGRLHDIVPRGAGSSTVSDGQSILYVSSQVLSSHPPVIDHVTSAVSLDEGLLWTAAHASGSVGATDGAHLFMSGEHVLRAADGQPAYVDPGLVDAVCLNTTQQAIFTTLPGGWMPVECRESNLRRFGLNDGVEQSICRLKEDDGDIQIVTQLIPTHDGGTIFAAASQAIVEDPKGKVLLRWTDADGNATFRAKLDGLDFHPTYVRYLGETAIAKGRWVVAGPRPGGGSAVIAYDVPGLALAAHGWLSPHGSQARSDAPW